MNKPKLSTFCATAILMVLGGSLVKAESGPLSIQETDLLLSQLVNLNDPGLARASSLKLRAAIRSDSPEIKDRIQIQLTDQLTTANNELTIRRACSVLSEASTEQVVTVLLERLHSESKESDTTRIAICDGIASVVAGLPSLSTSVALSIRKEIEPVLASRTTPQLLIDAAEMTAASLGTMGFDLLMATQRSGDNSRIPNVLYSALAATRDGRALPILRAAMVDSANHEGLRIQAINAMGRLVDTLQKSGTSIDTDELTACAQALTPLLADDAPDQLSSVALRSLGKIAGMNQDDRFRQTVLKALNSSSDYRREAALETMYQRNDPWTQSAMSTIQNLAESEPNLSIRSDAQALLDMWMAETQQPTDQ